MRSAVAMVTAITDATFTEEVLRHEGWKEIPAVFMTQALKFWRSMDPALEAEAGRPARGRGRKDPSPHEPFAAFDRDASDLYGFTFTYPNMLSRKCGNTAQMTRYLPGSGK
jgi:hypothetical protein